MLDYDPGGRTSYDWGSPVSNTQCWILDFPWWWGSSVGVRVEGKGPGWVDSPASTYEATWPFLMQLPATSQLLSRLLRVLMPQPSRADLAILFLSYPPAYPRLVHLPGSTFPSLWLTPSCLPGLHGDQSPIFQNKVQCSSPALLMPSGSS